MLLEKLRIQSNQSLARLESYASSASARYKSYPIAKRTGGFRIIEQPSKEIKGIQRWLNSALFSHFPVHRCATAYTKGASIKLNADRHVGSNFTIRIDFKEFFPSFTGENIRKFIHDNAVKYNLKLTNIDIEFVVRIVCKNDKLTIGAPSSPILTNILMLNFDEAMHRWSYEKQYTYTRYADDIFISSNHPIPMKEAITATQQSLSEFSYGKLSINSEKTVALTRKNRRSITGCVITTERKISIGRNRKEKIKSYIYKYKKNVLDLETATIMRGLVAFAKDVEPSFHRTLIRKYGADTMNKIQSSDFITDEMYINTVTDAPFQLF